MKMKCLWVLTFLIKILVVNAQTADWQNGSYIPASPEATALAKFINYPVNSSTGVPEIKIPLYEIQLKNMTLPIYLSYHASGMTLSQIEQKSDVGIGWVLNAEPMISRSINGLPDEMKDSGGNGYLYTPFHEMITIPRFKTLRFADGFYDGLPDAFYFRLPNKSGKYYFNRDFSNSNFNIVSTEPVKILPDLTQGYINFIKIIDIDGVVYKFGNSGKNEWSYNLYSAIGPSCWKANSIETPFNEEITFFYYDKERNEYPIYLDRVEIEDRFSYRYDIYKEKKVGCYLEDDLILTPEYFKYAPLVKKYIDGRKYLYKVDYTDDNQVTLISDDDKMIEYRIQKNLFERYGIDSINFTTGHIKFVRHMGKVSSIHIFSYQKLIKTINFFYSTNNLLTKIEFYSSSSEVTEKYTFAYNNGQGYSEDHWGYLTSNVFSNIEPTIPEQEVTALKNNSGTDSDLSPIKFTIGSVIKEADEGAKSYILKKITYPAGGYTTFEYELNKFKYNNCIISGGGLRIAKICSFDKDSSKPIVKTFKYGKNEDGFGYVKKPFIYDDYMFQQKVFHLNTLECLYSIGVKGWVTYLWPPIRSWLRTYNRSSLVNPFFSNGAPVLYDYVTEYIGDDIQNSGKKVFHFLIDTTTNNVMRIEGINSNIFVDYNYDWNWGTILSETDFKKISNQYNRVKKIEYNYYYKTQSVFNFKVFKKVILLNNGTGQVYSYSDLETPGIFDGFPSPPTLSIADLLAFANYSFTIGTATLTSEKTTLYGSANNPDGIFRNKIFTYNDLNQIKRITSNSSEGSTYITNLTYPQDIFSGVYAIMSQKSLYAEVVAEEKIKDGLPISMKKKEFSIWDDGIIAPHSITYTYGTSEPTVKLKYHKYDKYGNVLNITNEGGIGIGYIWGYKDKYPIVEYINCEENQIAYTSFEGPDMKGGWEFTNDFSTLSKTGIKSFSGVNVIKTGLPLGNYQIGFWGKIIQGSPNASFRINNVQQSIDGLDWQYYEFPLNSITSVYINLYNMLIDELRLHPVEAQMKTYTYDPLIGMTSSTDAAGQIIHYEYDDFCRLKYIKDTNGHLVEMYNYHYKE